MALSFEEVILMLRNALTFEEMSFNISSARNAETLKHYTRSRLQKLKEKDDRIKLKKYRYIDSLEIGEMTGKEILRVLVQVVNSELKVGSCLLVSVDGVAEAAFARTHEFQFDTLTERIEDVSKKGLYTKLFDDKRIDEYQQTPAIRQYYTKQIIQQLRQQLQQKWDVFMTKKYRESDPLWRKAFFGILCEVAKLEANLEHKIPEREELKQVPDAACIQMAVDSQRSGLLQDVFGEHEFDKKWRQAYIEDPNRREIYKESLKYRRQQRINATKLIMERYIPANKYDRYNRDDVEKVIMKTREMFM
uniref:uncharacterized protein LOC108950444 n=1 Tax=Ciona intestinalis TaxID=7719 RepID=UPI000180B11D|nr:uncharacterized protein LOC108950444 [Ciona intestinalis]|eukprot:XP_026694974.1 uncharacterized protein LOC108950444 [Ciona intestinalis]